VTPVAPGRLVALFFLHASIGGAIFARIPDIQQALGLSAGQLGLTLMGQPVGALTMFLISSRIIERFGPRRVALGALPLLAVAITLAALAPQAWMLACAMAVYGASFSLANVAMNVEADRIEAAIGRRIMNRCHGAWSIGFLGTALLGTAARGFTIPQGVHLGLLMPVLALLVLVVVWPMRSAPPRPHSGGPVKRLALPTAATLSLFAFGLSSALLEGGTRTWSIIFMRDTFDAPAWVDTLTLPAMLVTMSIGRLLADRLVERYGPVRVAGTLTCVAIAGLTMVVFAPNLVVALSGFALVGIGVCVSFPLMLSAAARIGDRPASQNVAATTLMMQLSGLLTPALLGWIAQTLGIRATFAVMPPFLLLSLLTVRRLGGKGE
jgi:fucose permease